MNQDGPSLIIEPPPSPRPSYSQRFSHMKNLLSIVFFVVLLSPVWWGLHDTLVPLDSTYGSPGPPKIKKKLITNFHQITSIFYMLLGYSFGVKSISKFAWGLEAYILNCLWVLLTHVYWFRATGGYICGCGRPSNLVNFTSLSPVLAWHILA